MSSPTTPTSIAPARPSPTSSGSDDSSILELSFDYEYNSEGKLVRISKDQSKSPQSSPPTPQELEAPKLSITASASATSPPTNGLLTVPRRASLSRSESMPSDLQPPSTRPLQRVISGPISMSVTPAPTLNRIAPLSTARKLGGARRVPRDEAREIEERIRREEELKRERSRRDVEEKENNADVGIPRSPHGRPVASLPSRQTSQGFPPPSRPHMIPKHKSGFNKINEVENSDGEREEPEIGRRAASMDARHRSHPLVTRPRRTPSESSAEALTPEDQNANAYAQRAQARYMQLPTARPATSLGFSSRARRVTYEERQQQELEIAERAEESDPERQPEYEPRISPSGSPTHLTSRPASRGAYTHQRRESDTLRSAAPPSAYQPYMQDNYDVEPEPLPPRISPSTRYASTATANAQSSAFSTSLGSRHRRSPTAPEHPTTSGTLVSNGVSGGREHVGKTWAAGENGYERDRERAAEEYGEHNKVAQRQNGTVTQQQAAVVQQVPQQQQPQQQAQQGAPDKARSLVVNKKPYARLDMVGKGGSSRVYRVMNSTNEIFAIKRVSLDKTDTETINGYMNEIALLKRLEGNHRIIRLIDSEVKCGSGNSKGHLMLVMECGEIDLAKLLLEQQKEPMNMVWISYYWQQILQAVHVIHEEKIVHSDLKPANFVLVKGQLKLIDFGIANAIANDTTNIQRDHQIGTVNYMSPEAIELPDGMRRLKVGRPSDVWSLGCILYQMVYGQPPFQQLSVYQKMKAIPDTTHVIEFPDHSVPTVPTVRNAQGVPATPPKRLDHLARPVRRDVIRSMQKCLSRNPRERATIPELLDEDWLAMKDTTPEQPKLELKDDETVINPYYMRQLLQYAIRVAREGKREMSDEEQMKEAERLVKELKNVSSSQS